MSKKKAKIGQFWMEGRFWAEFSTFGWNYYSLRNKLPKGDGHAVLVIPGFLASDVATIGMRNLLSHAGYATYGWGQGTNHGPTADVFAQLEAQLKALYASHGKVSLIGWSLGGVFARELGRRHPKLIRQIITLGSPFNATRDQFDPSLVELIENSTGKTFEEIQHEFTSGDNAPPAVPCTAVYSKTDGIAPWEACFDDPPDATHQNVEVLGSHMGLVYSLSVLWLIADRLAQPLGRWKKFQPKGASVKAQYPSIS